MQDRGLAVPLLFTTLLIGGCNGDLGSMSAWRDPAPHIVSSVQANGVALEVLDWRGDGPVIVFLHGFLATPHHFDALASALSDRYRVIAYARRAHGGSEARPPYSVDTLTEDLRGLLDALGIERASLAGWSMGGFEITEFAARYPARVDRVIYLDAAYDWTGPMWVEAAGAWPVDLAPPESATRSLDAYRDWLRSTDYAGVEWSDALEADLRSTVSLSTDGSLERVPRQDVIEAYSTSFFEPGSYPPRYGRVAAPTLAIYAGTWFPGNLPDPSGRVSRWTTSHYLPFKESSVEQLRRELPGVRTVLLDGGSHATFIHSEHDRVVASIRDFLRSP